MAAEAGRVGVGSTPTFVVNDRVIPGYPGDEAFAAAIEEALKGPVENRRLAGGLLRRRRSRGGRRRLPDLRPLRRRPLVCNLGDCHAVQSSHYATVAGVPVALLGLRMYLGVLAFGVLRWRRPDLVPATIAAFALALAGALYAAYLTYLQVAVIGAVCQWCVISAALTLALVAAEGRGVVRAVVAAPDV